MRRSQSGKALKIAIIAAISTIVLTGLVLLTIKVIIPTVKYNNAVSLMESGQYIEAIHAFRRLDGYKDSDKKIEQCELLREEQSDLEDLEWRYNKALAYMEQGKYDLAIKNFEKIPGYKDSESKRAECLPLRTEQWYHEAVQLISEGKAAQAAIALGKLGDYKDARTLAHSQWNIAAKRDVLSAGMAHSIGLKADGTVIAVGSYGYGVDNWTNIVAVSAGRRHSVGLRADGTVVASGNNEYGQCNVDQWQDIVAISASYEHTVGLRIDGTVVATGYNGNGQCNVAGWTDIIAVATGHDHTVGLKVDGTVVTAGLNDNNQCDVGNWQDIIAVCAGIDHTVGLKSNGKIVVAGESYTGQTNLNAFADVAAISVGYVHSIVLKTDGTVAVVGYNINGAHRLASEWTDIVAVSAGGEHILALTADGTVVAVGSNNSGQCNVSEWTGIAIP